MLNSFISEIRPLFLKQQQPFNGRLSGTTRVGQYQKKHSPAHTHPGQRTLSPFSICNSPRHYSRTTSFQVLFGLPLGLEPPTSYSMHFFTQSSFRCTCPYQRSLWTTLAESLGENSVPVMCSCVQLPYRHGAIIPCGDPPLNCRRRFTSASSECF